MVTGVSPAVAMPSMSAGLCPASAIALSAASACNWICDMSGMTPSRVVSAAPTMAIDFSFLALAFGAGGGGRRDLAAVNADPRRVQKLAISRRNLSR